MKCKICHSGSLSIFEHTAKCKNCGILLFYPYQEDNHLTACWSKDSVRNWYKRYSFYNHINFTNMLRFAMDESCKDRKIKVLDYGGAGGQFALICKSHFPESEVFLVDINDDVVLGEWKQLNNQIKFSDFLNDINKFDYIFLNDVFEHLVDPLSTLLHLSTKVATGGKIFIDTPKLFWTYPVTKLLSKKIYKKLLIATVSKAHLQIWTKKSFQIVIKKAGLKIDKYAEIKEFTKPADRYLNSMEITNPVMELIARIFYHNAKYLLKNKTVCLLSQT